MPEARLTVDTEIIQERGGKQILCEDPAATAMEIFQPRVARLLEFTNQESVRLAL